MRNWVAPRCGSARGARLRFEVLESRRFPSASSGPSFEPPPDSRAADSSTSWAAPNDPIGLYRHGLLVQSFVPATDTDADRGIALRVALAAAHDGDELILGPVVFDMGAFEHVEFPDRVTVTGAGRELTRITSNCPQGNDPAATFTLNNETVIQDLWLEGSLLDGQYQPLVGMQGGPVENVSTYLRRVRITGDSDGIFLWTGQVYRYTIYAYDCEIHTRYDAVAVLGSGNNPQSVLLYNCTLNVSQPDPIGAHISNAVNARSGFVGLYNCEVNVTGDAESSQTTGIWTWNYGRAVAFNSTFDVTAPAGQVYDLFIDNTLGIDVYAGQGSGPGGAYTSLTASERYWPLVPATVVQAGPFYNNSFYDDYQPRPGGRDSGAALAVDKLPLLPDTGPATFQNVSNYERGLNGVIVDLAGQHGSITADDFELRIGNDNQPHAWVPAPPPSSVTVYGDAGLSGSDRIEIIWPDGAITDTWLSLTLLANADTNLAAPSTLYFGSAVGNSGLGDTTVAALTNATDEIAARNNPATRLDEIALTNPYDFNRDGTVDATDQLIARNNPTSIVTALRYLDLSTVGGSVAPIGPNSAAAAVKALPAAEAVELESIEPAPTNLDEPLRMDFPENRRRTAIRRARGVSDDLVYLADELFRALLANRPS